MRVLIIKTSSLGDIVHTFSAVTEAKKHCPDIVFDWAVEETFMPFVKLHPDISNIIPINIREFKGYKIFNVYKFFSNVAKLIYKLNNNEYDIIIDAQGLIKSAFISRLVKGKIKRMGFDMRSIRREKLAALFYNNRINVPQGTLASNRIRELFAKVFDYDISYSASVDVTLKITDYSILTENKRNSLISLPKVNSSYKKEDEINPLNNPYIVMIISGSCQSKEYPIIFFRKLSRLAQLAGYKVIIPWYTGSEKIRSFRLANFGASSFNASHTEELVSLLKHATAVIGTDTGLTHLANTLDVPTIGLYGPTSSKLTGLKGFNAKHIVSNYYCSPCFRKECQYIKEIYPPCYNTLPPDNVWEVVEEYLPILENIDNKTVEELDSLKDTNIIRSITLEDIENENIEK